jgi:hypothetical protein
MKSFEELTSRRAEEGLRRKVRQLQDLKLMR